MDKPDSKQTNQRLRRNLLGALTVGAATAKLPDLWAKPIVESVLLPAHAVATDQVLRSGGGGGETVTGGVLPLLDGVVPKAHAVNSDYPGCASFEWITDADGTSWQPNSLKLVLLAMKCPAESHLYKVLENLQMAHMGGSTYGAVGDGDWDVVLEMTNPLAGPGEQFGNCSVKLYNSFPVFRGETCSADHPDEDSCGSGDICVENP